MWKGILVFVFGYTALAGRIGGKHEPKKRQTEWFLILMPNKNISTAEKFAHQGLTKNTHPIKIADFVERSGKNDCQPVVEALYLEVKKARQWLDQFAYARLTGTGACLFSSFASEAEAKLVLKQIPAPWQGFVAKGVNKSPLLKFLPPR